MFQYVFNNGSKDLDSISCFGPLLLNNHHVTLPPSKSQPKVLKAAVPPEVAITSPEKAKARLLQLQTLTLNS